MLGDLSERDREEVAGNLRQYPELQEELARLEETQELMLAQTALQPRAAVKEALLAKIASRPRQLSIPLKNESSRVIYWRYTAAASVVLALLTSYLAYDYRVRLKIAETSLTEYIAQNERMAQEYNNVSKRLGQIQNELVIIENPDFLKVRLDGTPNAPGSVAQVYWNADTRELFLRVQNLKQLAADNQYQLWAIVDGKPVDAGVFNATVTGLIKMKDIGGAAAFAVTIEPRGGNDKPTLETMQVIGNVQKS